MEICHVRLGLDSCRVSRIWYIHACDVLGVTKLYPGTWYGICRSSRVSGGRYIGCGSFVTGCGSLNGTECIICPGKVVNGRIKVDSFRFSSSMVYAALSL